MFTLKLIEKLDRLTEENIQNRPSIKSDTAILEVHDIVCDYIQETETAILSVGGFGQPDWKADVGTDLLTILGQLPKSVDSAIRNEDFNIDFYEQGMERTIHFSGFGDMYKLRCTLRTEPDGDILSYELPASTVCEILKCVLSTFLYISQAIFPELMNIQSFANWSESIPV